MIAFLGVYIWGYQLDVRFGSLSGPFKLFLSKITWPFSQKSHECALKLTDLWNTSLLFDLNYKFINGSFAFSPGLIYILRLSITGTECEASEIHFSLPTIIISSLYIYQYRPNYGLTSKFMRIEKNLQPP